MVVILQWVLKSLGTTPFPHKHDAKRTAGQNFHFTTLWHFFSLAEEFGDNNFMRAPCLGLRRTSFLWSVVKAVECLYLVLRRGTGKVYPGMLWTCREVETAYRIEQMRCLVRSSIPIFCFPTADSIWLFLTIHLSWYRLHYFLSFLAASPSSRPPGALHHICICVVSFALCLECQNFFAHQVSK